MTGGTNTIIDSDGNKIVNFNTNSKKMMEYMNQHNIQAFNHTTENNTETPSTNGNTIQKHSKKQPERIDLDNIYAGYI